MISTVAGILFALLKAIPALRQIFTQLVELDQQSRKAEASNREVAKNAAVDAALGDSNGLRAAAPGQQPEVNAPN